jgi:L-idonate 5-dehydrogenase
LAPTEQINVANGHEPLSALSANKGYFEVHFEAAGSERAVRPGLKSKSRAARKSV